MSESNTDCYIGIKNCGCIVALVYDHQKYRKDTAETVAEFIESGYRVERAVFDEVKHKLKRCKCNASKNETTT